ncbi:MAG: glycine-rich protein, partial [Roseiarcus sp.]
MPGEYLFTAPSAGAYMVDVWGAQGGASSVNSGGLGAGVGVDVALTAGEEVLVIVGAEGGYGPAAGGGGWVKRCAFSPHGGYRGGRRRLHFRRGERRPAVRR